MTLKPGQQENDPVNDSYWENMRSHDYGTSFHAVKDFIRQNSQKRKSPNKRRRYIAWLLVALLPLLIFFSCKRETYIEPQDATLGFLAKDSVQSAIELAIQQHADKRWRVVMKSHAGIIHGTVYAPTETHNQLKALAEKLKTITGVTELYLSSLSTAVEESRLSRLSYKIFDRHVDATSASDEQLRTEIETKLKAIGQYDLKVQLMKENGKRQVKFEPTGNDHEFSVALTLSDGTNVTATAEKWDPK
jgi:hypothetical protein